MKKYRLFTIFLKWPILMTLILALGVLGDPLQKKALSQTLSPSDKSNENEAAKKKIQQLRALFKEIKWLERAVKEQDEIKDFQAKLARAEKTFWESASQIQWTDNEEEGAGEKKRDLLREFQDLLTPLLDAVRRASERPRKIEGIRTEIQRLNEKMAVFEKGQSNLEALLIGPGIDFQEEIHKGLRIIKKKKEELSLQLESRKRTLDQELQKSSSLVDAWTDFFKNFVERRGKNLFLAFLCFFLPLWMMIFLKKRLFTSNLLTGSLSWLVRPVSLLYGAMTVGISFSLSLLCLNLLNDWPLMTLWILLFFSILWSLKQFAPRFIEEGRILLHFGTVREGERLVWNGIPWKVKNLGFPCLLENELLEGGLYKVGISDLAKLHSRPYSPSEIWFPCQKGDFVLLNDGTFGQVSLQTPEQVILLLLGQTLKTYPTHEFLKQCPQNLSHGFRIEVTLGLDYKLSPLILGHILPLFEKEIPKVWQGLSSSQSGNGEIGEIGKNSEASNWTGKWEVEFLEAGASSLNIWVKMDCPGIYASQRNKLKRKLNLVLLEICRQHHLDIPFNQLTLHMAREREGHELPQAQSVL